LDDEFLFALETTTEMLRQDRDGLVISMLRYILFGMNWADYASDTDQLERLVLSGYKYNFWTTPTRLQIAGREL